MALNDDDIRDIAWLARLTISEADIPRYSEELSKVLGLVEQMNELNTDTVTPMAHPTDASQRLREDIVTESNQREHFQKNAPLAENGLYLVPRVIE